MQAVSDELLETIQDLLQLPGLAKFALAGGTNLALRYNHRISEDIDLFCTDIIGKKGFEKISDEVTKLFGNKIIRLQYPLEINDQFTHLRFLVARDGLTIKVDVIQNMKALYDFEQLNGIRLYSVKDIGLFKLVSCSSRPAKKDIYDLDYITDNEESLVNLYSLLKKKKNSYNADKDRNIFDLDEDPDPIDDPHRLLLFDKRMATKQKMLHSHDNIKTLSESKSWHSVSIHWRMKVRELYRVLNVNYPL